MMTFDKWFWDTPNELGLNRSDYAKEYCKGDNKAFTEVVLMIQEAYDWKSADDSIRH